MIRKLLYSLAIGISISLFLTLLFSLGVFRTWQEALSDNLFFPRTPRSDIVIIAIDDKSIQSIGRWPWDRKVHAQLLNILGQNPKVIGLDISFFEKSTPESDQALAVSLKNSGKVVLAAEEVEDIIFLPLIEFTQNSKWGLVNTHADSDGITRRTKIQFTASDTAFGWEIAKLAGVINPPKTDNGLLRINFAGGPKSFKSYSFIDVLNTRIPESEFRDKIVLIGATAPDLHDTQLVPTSDGIPMPGVEIHANILDTILSGKYLRVEKPAVTIATIFTIAIILSLIFILGRISLGIFATLIITSVYIIYSIVSFDNGVVRNLIYPPLAALLTAVGSILYRYMTELAQKRFLKRAFSQYVTSEVVNEIINHPDKLKLGGDKKTITVLFSDIEGFTTISEKTEPEKLTSNLNNYLSQMTDIVFAHQGVLDKFIGDSVMAFWGAPLPNKNHALDACRAALEMKEVNIGGFKTRIGINTGEVVIGNMGSDKRFDYTVLGDAVNTASRLEGLNKNYKTQILISETTYQEVKNKVKVKKVDHVAVRGKTKAIIVYELLGLKED